ncbi:oxygenase MpaB family protein, partial [Streptomyces recifensis]|uniref:oxygenase MpaB family protein n=1 Tax=Streptomyces recifensis TaxID=67355 RepID=UPI001FCA3069
MDEVGARDPGLFTPASVTWQLHGDPMMWIAGIRALYLQALHPRAVRGVLPQASRRKSEFCRTPRTARGC